ncbi:MAG TPA: aldehyde dehydrogenase family protein [Acidimicrobiales bacterium]|nr:aldehyde dehydrogenase family protein [Acidimicrobiales bacterium]
MGKVDDVTDRVGLVLGGAVEAGDAPPYAVTNPVRPAEVVFHAPAASPAQLDRAVEAARRSFPSWSARDAEDRAALVIAAAEAGVAAVDAHDLARLLTREHGKVYWEAVFDASTMAAMASGFAPLAAEALRSRSHGAGSTSVEWVPHGVVAAVLPFNWPVSVMANKVLPALLTGNTVVVKAPPTCPGAVLLVAAAMAEVLPAGVLNVLNGPDAELGAALVGHRDIDMVSFTGGVPTGQAVMAAAASGVRPVVLELGGNDAAILAPDVVVDDTLAGRLVEAAFVTSGQVCMAVKRLYVHRDRFDETMAALIDRLSVEVVGDGLADGVTMGPVHLARSRDRVEAFIAEAEQGGAKVHRPGRIRQEDSGAGGYLVSPALVEDPALSARIVCEEQFAPALPVLAYDDLDDAVHWANDTSFGLCASIWSDDDALTASVARRLQAGTVFVNTHGLSAIDMQAPMGGWKHSGLGVELGAEGMRAFAHQRVVVGQVRPTTEAPAP